MQFPGNIMRAWLLMIFLLAICDFIHLIREGRENLIKLICINVVSVTIKITSRLLNWDSFIWVPLFCCYLLSHRTGRDKATGLKFNSVSHSQRQMSRMWKPHFSSMALGHQYQPSIYFHIIGGHRSIVKLLPASLQLFFGNPTSVSEPGRIYEPFRELLLSSLLDVAHHIPAFGKQLIIYLKL